MVPFLILALSPLILDGRAPPNAGGSTGSIPCNALGKSPQPVFLGGPFNSKCGSGNNMEFIGEQLFSSAVGRVDAVLLVVLERPGVVIRAGRCRWWRHSALLYGLFWTVFYKPGEFGQFRHALLKVFSGNANHSRGGILGLRLTRLYQVTVVADLCGLWGRWS